MLEISSELFRRPPPDLPHKCLHDTPPAPSVAECPPPLPPLVVRLRGNSVVCTCSLWLTTLRDVIIPLDDNFSCSTRDGRLVSLKGGVDGDEKEVGGCYES